MEENGIVRLATSCSEEKCCPVADYNASLGKVIIYDPEKPARGQFVFEKDEWDAFVASFKTSQ